MLARRIQEQEEATIRRIVDAMPWPADVKGYDVEFGSDWEGDPVVRVWLLVDDDLRPSAEKLKRVGGFTREVAQALRPTARCSAIPGVMRGDGAASRPAGTGKASCRA